MSRERGPVRIGDVARETGYSVATVSRALSPRTAHTVAPATRATVEDVARRLGYRPNEAARSLRTRRSRTVGVVIPDIANPLFPRIVRGIDDELRRHGFTSLLANTDDDPARADEAFGIMLQREVEALVIATATLDDAVPSELDRTSTPVVLMNRRTADTALPSVSAAGMSGTEAALRWLVDRGHVDIAVLAAPQETSTGRDRLREVDDAARRQLGRRLPVVTTAAVTIDEGRRAAVELLGAHPRPTAVLAANDLMAVGAIQAVRGLGLACPGDVSVVGFNDMPFADLLDPALSTIGFDHYAMGTQTARLALTRIAGEAATSVTLPTTWLARGSTAAVPGG